MRNTWLPACLLATAFITNAGCGAGSTVAPPVSVPPPPSNIVVTIAPTVSGLDSAQSVSLTATVSDAGNNRGVLWTLSCSSGANTCGSMAQASTASGAANKYTAPSVTVADTVNVSAFSAADHTKGTSVQITVNPPPTLTGGALPTGTVGTRYNPRESCSWNWFLHRYICHFVYGFNLIANGGVQPYVLSWAATSGSSLPPGLTFSGGLVDGTPTLPGTYNIVVTVTDSGLPPLQASANYTLTVQ